ncbi:MAG: PIG-L family deacetylase [Armatimonadetes bacterium]|nr:PIG-L family deacetylase [Armatimonadota bacterium]
MHILVIGAHPDDAEYRVGGTAALWRGRGDEVRYLSVTDGRRGHYAEEYAREPEKLAARRRAEARAAAALIGVSCADLGVPDGEVYVTPQTTMALVREIRRFGPEPGAGPDLVITSRPVDYHRDHRYAAQMVLDASYMLTVPLLCPDTPALARMPVIAYWFDDFTEAGPFRGDVIVGIDAVLDSKNSQLAAHESQFFEWLPFNRGELDRVPAAERLAWLRRTTTEPVAAHVRSVCAEKSHAPLPPGRHAEAFQISEYGRRPLPTELAALFPPSNGGPV